MSDAPGTSRALIVVALVIGLAVGLGVALLLGRSGGADQPAGTTGSETRDGDAEATAELPPPDALMAPEEATDPEAALRGYLAAEAAGEWERSYDFLTTEEREVAYPSTALWVSAHADFPTVTGYRIDDVQVEEEGGTATIQTLTGFEPMLDPVLGLVAARGRTTWALQQDEDGTWRVDAAATTNQPLYPDSDGAAEALRAWVDTRVACEDTADMEAGLVGTPALARALCEEEQEQAIEITAIGALTDSSDVAPLLSQFGPEVFAWARTARVQAATPFVAVLAPIGEEWRVVGVLPARA